MNAVLLACALTFGLAAAGYAKPPGTATEVTQVQQTAPDAEIKAFVAALRHDRALQLLSLSKPESELRRGYASEQAGYAKRFKRGGAVNTPEPEFEALWSQLQTAAGRKQLETTWLNTVDQQLPRFRAQWPMYLAMARATLEARTDLAPDTRAALGELLLALDKFVFELDLADRGKLRASISDLATLVHSSSVTRFHDLPTLEFEALIALAQRAMLTGKRIALRYGLDINHALDSFEILVTRSSADNAVLTMQGKVLGAPLIWREHMAWDGKTWSVAPDRVYESTDDAPGRVEQFLH